MHVVKVVYLKLQTGSLILFTSIYSVTKPRTKSTADYHSKLAKAFGQ